MRIFVIGGVAVDSRDPGFPEEKELLARTCQPLGRAIRAAGHTTVLCSPFEDSADLEVLRGLAAASELEPSELELHYPALEGVKNRFAEVLRDLGLGTVRRHPSPPLDQNEPGTQRYTWLLAQLRAMEASNVVIAVGGKPDGAATMLLRLAEMKKGVLPVSFLGGAARQAYDRKRYELQDRLGEDAEALQDSQSVDRLVELAERLASPEEQRAKARGKGPLRFFISYPRARPGEADYVEMLLRRRNQLVFRDDKNLEPGHEIQESILNELRSANVFVALWSREYACSPWCFDELELALELNAKGALKLWLLCVDDTRMVHPRARNLLNYRIRSREELEGKVSTLLEQLNTSSSTSDPTRERT